MEENSECKNCSTWEEEMYWKHFNSMHFCQTLQQDFHDHLVLPEKFAANMKTQLPDKVPLKGPGGASWEIELLKCDDLLFVGNEWKDFVKANDLKENCLLVFKYKRNLGFEVIIIDEGSSCEKESAYFVKKCRHTKSDLEVVKKRSSREASSTEVIEDDGDEDSPFVVSKKSRKEDGLVACSGEKVNFQTPRKRVVNAAARRRGRPRRVQPCKSTIKPNVRSSEKNSISDEAAKDLSHASHINVITPDNGESFPEKDHSHKLESQSKKNLNGDDAAREPNLISTIELITPENGENSQAADRSQTLKAQSENQPSGDVSVIQPSQIFERNLIENGELFQVIDHSPIMKAQSEKLPSRDDTSNKLKWISDKELNTPENDLVEKELMERGTAKKLKQISGREMIRPDYKESSAEEDRACKTRVKRGRGKKQNLPKSSKKLVFKSVSDGKRFSREYISNRRAVTEMEKEDALQRANTKLTPNSFIAVMRPTGVYKRFFLSVPANWLHKYLPRRNQEIVLRVKDQTWVTSLFYYGSRGGGLSTGWKKFALENFLEEFDVLVFKLVSKKDEVAVLDVDIFRVVSNIVPPLPMIS
ncbi:hypothetical protein BVRB_4g084290 isoform A [Beta vulgaris subsp. vulgaris]|nr:hypothetical protein BVRB_4g084290 isoform A [Beta vulgaris subsp. vulgaris]